MSQKRYEDTPRIIKVGNKKCHLGLHWEQKSQLQKYRTFLNFFKSDNCLSRKYKSKIPVQRIQLGKIQTFVLKFFYSSSFFTDFQIGGSYIIRRTSIVSRRFSREKCPTLTVASFFSRRFSREKCPTLTVSSFFFFFCFFQLTISL